MKWQDRVMRGYAAVLLLLAASLLLRAPGFTSSVLDPDEGLYMVQAVAWLAGRWPYVAVWDMHPTGAPALFALAKALIPDPVLAMRLVGAVAVAATAIGLRALALLLGESDITAFFAGLLYVAHSVVLGGLASNTEILFAPFVVLTAWLLLREALLHGPPRTGAVLLAGLSAGMAVWIKQIAVLECSALWLTLVAVAWSGGRLALRRVLLLALVFAAGAGLPSLAVAAAYWVLGHLDAWLQGNIFSLLSYGMTVPEDTPGLRRGLVPALGQLIWLILAACCMAAERRGRMRLLLPWLLAATLAVAAPWKFYSNHFLILLAPLSLLAAIGLAALMCLAVHAGLRRRCFAGMAALVAALPVSDMLLPRLAYGAGLRGEDPGRQVAELVQAALRPGEPLYVANWHTITYVLAGQAPPTPYAFADHLAGHFNEVTGIDADAELARVLALPPGAIVVAPYRWGSVRPEARKVIEAAIAQGYELFASTDDGRGEVQVWRRRDDPR